MVLHRTFEKAVRSYLRGQEVEQTKLYKFAGEAIREQIRQTASLWTFQVEMAKLHPELSDRLYFSSLWFGYLERREGTMSGYLRALISLSVIRALQRQANTREYYSGSERLIEDGDVLPQPDLKRRRFRVVKPRDPVPEE